MQSLRRSALWVIGVLAVAYVVLEVATYQGFVELAEATALALAICSVALAATVFVVWTYRDTRR